jgi:hypothetical protein
MSQPTQPRGVLDDARKPLSWWELNRAAGLSLDETEGDGVGRYTPQDKTKILDALYLNAEALERGEA